MPDPAADRDRLQLAVDGCHQCERLLSRYRGGAVFAPGMGTVEVSAVLERYQRGADRRRARTASGRAHASVTREHPAAGYRRRPSRPARSVGGRVSRAAPSG